MIIAIDGHSSTGKSSFAKEIAKRWGLAYLDTGALYRVITLYALSSGLIASDHSINTDVLYSKLSEIDLDSHKVDTEIRSLRVSEEVSHISSLAPVRDYVNRFLQGINIDQGIVADGRDIASAVFPNADIKIFMTANSEIRAERRLKELLEKGENVSFDEVHQNILKRDYIDQSREVAPLIRVKDAIELDNSYMSIQEQLDWVDKLINEHKHS